MYVCTYTSQHPALTQHQTSKIQSENFIAKVVYQLDVVNIVSKLIETFGYLLKPAISSQTQLCLIICRNNMTARQQDSTQPISLEHGTASLLVECQGTEEHSRYTRLKCTQNPVSKHQAHQRPRRQTAPGRSATWQKHRSEGSRAQ